ncbi:MAG TPA: photosystem II reaction center protein T [Cyanobacteria bacterium UBA11162]|nr:photosystem II reaction center protein T [Cyanobacteria bacterium UBA12227]HAX85038.1 photosystem II reaction center protein T [Cyanobacteria bacterium UBA11370]HBL10299.1 photosystem II reaction center protein T [Cyanobacteria bacterium UBA11162]HBY80214.1 photosystem II reaction center protein T [Cyanobacteria bacterium UBA11148]
MESLVYIFVVVVALGVLFFAIAFREPPRIEKK